MGLRDAMADLRGFDTAVRACGTGACVRVPRAWRGGLVCVRSGKSGAWRGLAKPCGGSAHLLVPKAVRGERVRVERPEVWGAVRGFAEGVRREVPGAEVFFFGSHLRGNPGRDSDVDLMVVTPRRLREEGRWRLVDRLWGVFDHPGRPRVEVLWRTRGEFHRERGLCGIVDEVLRTGVEV